MRGIILHKIMEEFVTGELKADADAVRGRAQRLVQELAGSAAAPGLDLAELAETALRTWPLPEVTEHKAGLIAEVPIYGRLDGEDESLVAGRADAIGYRSGKPHIVFDWKSDVAPDALPGLAMRVRLRNTLTFSGLNAALWFTCRLARSSGYRSATGILDQKADMGAAAAKPSPSLMIERRA